MGNFLAAERKQLEALTPEQRLELAKKWQRIFWGPSGMSLPEDKRIDALIKVCTTLCLGNLGAGEQLARESLYG